MKEKMAQNLMDKQEDGLAMAQLLNDVDGDMLAESLEMRPAARYSWYKGLAAVLALALLCSWSSLAWAVNTLQQENKEFYLRYLTPDMLALQTESVTELDITKQPERLFVALQSDDIYYQYIAVNRLVEFYNDPDLRARAVSALQPFLNSPEPKLAEAAALALDILTNNLQNPQLYHMADGSIFFTLFNDYSDYGSHNQIWRIKDGQLSQYTSFLEPMSYITGIYPSPDGRLLAVSLSSNKSNFAVVLDFINGYISSELVGSARALWANRLVQQGITNRAAVIRSDFETYSSCYDLQWLNNTTLRFEADLCFDDSDTSEYDACEIVDSVNVNFDYATREYSFQPAERE